MSEIRKLLENSRKMKKLLEDFLKVQEDERGVTRLLTAFYVRQVGCRITEEDNRFEFTHKSFGEYLAAGRLVRLVSSIHKKLSDDDNEDYDETRALQEWAKYCGPAAVDHNMFSFIKDEVKLFNKREAANWQKTLCSLINHMLRKGMPMEKLETETKLNYKKMSEWSRNAEEALLVLLYSMAEHTEEMSEIGWPDNVSFGEWLTRLQGQRISGEGVIALQCLGYMKIVDQVIYAHDFIGADFRFSSFVGCDLMSALLVGANMSYTHLEHIMFRGAILEGADLEGAKLEGANLEWAKLEGANLREANLREADLEGSDLEGVNLEGSDLEGANLKRTILEKKD